MGGAQSSGGSPPPMNVVVPVDSAPPPTMQKGVFDKPPPPNLSLGIGEGKSTNCLTCAITIDPTLSSATVTLTRDILGKIQQPPLPYPPSNLPKLDPASGVDKFGNGKNGCGRTGGKGYGPPGNVCCNNGCDYTVPYSNSGDKPTKLSWADGTVLSDHGTHRVDGDNTNIAWTNEYLAQLAEEIQHKKDWDAKNAGRLQVRIWNPSDDPKDTTRSIAINNREFGALTKLYIKPTIPFPISFSLAGPNVPRSEPPPAPPAEGQRQRLLNEQTQAGNKLESDKEARQAAQTPRTMEQLKADYKREVNEVIAKTKPAFDAAEKQSDKKAIDDAASLKIVEIQKKYLNLGLGDFNY